MIKVICGKCGQETDVTKDGLLEINLAERCFYFKCKECKETQKIEFLKDKKTYYPSPGRM